MSGITSGGSGDPQDGLIARLASGLRPVTRLRPPWMRAASWLALSGAIAVLLALVKDLHPIAARLMAAPDMWLSVVGSALTAVLGAWATFQLSLPDRSGAWALLPLPSALLWLGASGLGCLRTWLLPGMHPADMGETFQCFRFIVGLSLPLSVLLVVMLRRAAPLRPGLASVVGGLAVAAAAATLLVFAHPYDASATDLAVHVIAVALVVIANRAIGGRLLAMRFR
jgi:hypothetical protein